MPIYNVFSKRKNKTKGETQDVFEYDNLPNPFRVQVVHIIRDALGEPSIGGFRGDYVGDSHNAYEFIHDSLCREYGLFTLVNDFDGNYATALFNYFLQTNDIDKALDVIEMAFVVINNIASRHDFINAVHPKIRSESAISELNERFLEHAIGYQFESGKIIRVDSKIAHKEIIKPALQLLTSDKAYKGANDEFLTAHEHYRNGRTKECLSFCLASFESTLKAICEKRKWTYSKQDTANKLLKICFENKLIPSFLQSHYESLQNSLVSGVPTIRNNLGGHGQGVEEVEVPPFIAQYMLNLTATSIVMFIEAEKNMGSKK